jgi:hypothetical protein
VGSEMCIRDRSSTCQSENHGVVKCADFIESDADSMTCEDLYWSQDVSLVPDISSTFHSQEFEYENVPDFHHYLPFQDVELDIDAIEQLDVDNLQDSFEMNNRGSVIKPQIESIDDFNDSSWWLDEYIQESPTDGFDSMCVPHSCVPDFDDVENSDTSLLDINDLLADNSAVPTEAVRMMCLVDCDPDGISIFCTYKYGSKVHH